MNKFSDVLEATKETVNPDKLSDIETNSSMSDVDVENFWKSEFANAMDSMEMDPYERLVSETYGRDEDEINIEFDFDDQLLQILDRFRPENWADKTEAQRVKDAEEVIQNVGERLGLDRVPTLSLYDGENDDYGSFDSKKNEISINRNHLDDPSETLNTIAHELRHAYQRFRSDKLETWEDNLYNFNYENYIAPLSLPGGKYLYITDYYGQYVEADARAFANKFMEAIKS